MAEVVEGEMVESRSSNRGAMAMVLEDEPWVKRIRESLTVKDKDDDVDIHVSVFDVPKQLQVHKPEAYSPQFIGLGPYHHRHPELYGMERYKIDAARRVLKRLLRTAPGPSPSVDVLDELVKELKDRDLMVRAHYHRYLELSVEALSLMMIMDGAFLLEFLTIHHHHHAAADGEGEGDSSTWTKRMEHLVDLGGSGTGNKKSAHGLILRDMLMLENQIPLFVLIMIKAKWSSMSPDESSKRLTFMVTGLMNELCPFKMNGIFPETSCNVTKHAHLLELLYHLVVPAVPTPTDTTENAHTTPPFSGHIVEIQGQEEKPSTATGSEHVNVMMQLFDFIAPKLRGGRLGKVMKPIELVVKAPWNKLTGSIPGMPVESSMSADANQQEITIPSVSELVSAGVKFEATHGNLSSEKTITFNRKTATLSLPAVTLDGNTEVVLRNLVAYESSAAKGPLVLTRYTELMNGIIDTDDDVALLRKRGVVLNHMKMKKRDGEAAKLWNGMSRSVQHSRVPTLDKVIEEVNRYYDGRWRVKTKRFMRKYVLSSWKMLTFLATISMLLLTTVQAFCSVYTCSRWWFGDLVAVVPSESE